MKSIPFQCSETVASAIRDMLEPWFSFNELWRATKRRKIVRTTLEGGHSVTAAMWRDPDEWKVFRSLDINFGGDRFGYEEWASFDADPTKPIPLADRNNMSALFVVEDYGAEFDCPIHDMLGALPLTSDDRLSIIEECEGEGVIDADGATLARMAA